MDNPLLNFQQFPDFQSIQPEHFETAVDQVIADFYQTLDQVIQAPYSWENTIQPLEEASNHIDAVWNVISHINSVENTDAIREAFDKVLPKISEFSTDVMQNEKLYHAYLEVKNSEEFNDLSAAQKAIVTHSLRDFKLAGVELDEAKRARFKKIQQALSDLGNRYSKHILDATQAWTTHILPEQKSMLEGLPEHTIALAKQKADKEQESGWILTLDFPCYHAVMTHAKNRNLRQIFYEAYVTRASDQGPYAGQFDNGPLIDEIVALRQEMAKILGLENYANVSLVPKMAKDAQHVMHFLEDLAQRSKSAAKEEYQTLEAFAKQVDKIDHLEVWDAAYYSELYQQQHYQVSEQALRPYFPEDQVLSGMFNLVKKLYGIECIEEEQGSKIHPSVWLFKVIDEQGNLRGHFYADLYARQHKRGGAWMADYISRFKHQTGLQTPVAFLNANFTPPLKGKSATLSHDEVITLFHEFGHTLHHLLTQIDYLGVAGINGVEWDAVELPSQFMENWCWEWDVVQTLTKHVETGEHLPKAEFDKLLETKNYQSAMQMMRQLEFALFDFRLHLNQGGDQHRTPQQVLDDVRSQVAVIQTPGYNRFQNSFSHVFNGGYAAGYYSYKWAEVLSSDVFEMFKENGTLNPSVGRAFMHEILEKGGSETAMTLFVNFRGREPNIEPLLKHSGIYYS